MDDASVDERSWPSSRHESDMRLSKPILTVITEISPPQTIVNQDCPDYSRDDALVEERGNRDLDGDDASIRRKGVDMILDISMVALVGGLVGGLVDDQSGGLSLQFTYTRQCECRLSQVSHR
jgi:hypothetical protein